MGQSLQDGISRVQVATSMSIRKESKEEKDYHAFLSALSNIVKRDPFPISAPHKVDYWADNKKVLSALVRAEAEALIFPSSRIHVFYGPLGGGKSFAVSYLADPNTKKVLMKHVAVGTKKDFLSLSVPASYPLKTGMLTGSVYLGIFKKLLHEIVSDPSLFASWRTAIRQSTPNALGIVDQALGNMVEKASGTLSGKISVPTLEGTEGYKLLTLGRSRLGSLKTQDDYVSVIKSITEPLLTKYQRIMIAIDELEGLRSVTGSERLFFNDFVRRLVQEIEVGVIIVLIFTRQTFEEVESVLQPAVLSRVSEKIHFDFLRSKHDIVEYVQECLQKGAAISPSDVIDPAALEAVAADLIKHRREVTFRDINKHIISVFATLYAQKKRPAKITKEAYEEITKKISVEDVIRELGAES